MSETETKFSDDKIRVFRTQITKTSSCFYIFIGIYLFMIVIIKNTLFYKNLVKRQFQYLQKYILCTVEMGDTVE